MGGLCVVGRGVPSERDCENLDCRENRGLDDVCAHGSRREHKRGGGGWRAAAYKVRRSSRPGSKVKRPRLSCSIARRPCRRPLRRSRRRRARDGKPVSDLQAHDRVRCAHSRMAGAVWGTLTEPKAGRVYEPESCAHSNDYVNNRGKFKVNVCMYLRTR